MCATVIRMFYVGKRLLDESQQVCLHFLTGKYNYIVKRQYWVQRSVL